MAEIEKSEEAAELYGNARLIVDSKDYAKAVAMYSEVLKLLPNDSDSFTYNGEAYTKDEIYKDRGSCYNSLEQPEKALDDFNKAISINPKNARFYSDRSSVYLALGETEKAKADLEKSVELKSEKAADEYCNFGLRVLKYTGNKKEAAVYLKKAVELGDDRWGTAKKRLAELGI